MGAGVLQNRSRRTQLPIGRTPGTRSPVRISSELKAVAARQHGLVALHQAAAFGVSRSAWYRATTTGLLVPVAPLVAALPGAPATDERHILAAVLAAGGAAIASHRSAAHLWGVEIAGADPVDITTTDRSRPIRLPWLRLHTPTDVQDLRPVRRHGIPTTNPVRVLVDLGQVAPGAVPAALERFMVEGLVGRAAVAGALARHGRRGRHGITALRQAFEAWAIDDKPPDSVLELTMARLLRTYQLPKAVFHLSVAGREVDFGFPTERVAVECDGWDHHGRDRVQFERDRARDGALAAAGWLVLRFTWRQITQQPAWVARTIRATLAQRIAP